MSDSVLQTAMVCSLFLILLGGLGVGILWKVWRHDTGRDQLEQVRRKVIAEKIEHDGRLRIEAPKKH